MATFDLTAAGQTQTAVIPLRLTVPGNSTTDTATVACTQTSTGASPAPAAVVTSTIDAIQTGGDFNEPDTAATTG